MQTGGASGNEKQPSITEQVASMLESGADPRSVVNQLLSSGLDEADIREIFMDLGMSSSDLDALFETEEQAAEEQQQMEEAYAEAEEQQASEEDSGSDSDVQFGAFGNDIPEAQFGVETPLSPTINQFFGGIARQRGDDYVRNPMANYLPMDLGTKGEPIGAAFMLAEAATDLFGGKKDPSTGLKEGFFRDVEAKKARQKAAIPSYYNYKVTTAAGDENEYVADKVDLYNAAKNNGSLRTKDQYLKDVAANSQLDYNTKTGKYDALISSRPVDKTIYSDEQRKKLDEFLGKSTSLETLNKRFDPETKKMILESEKAGMASLGISPSGQASSYKDAQTNPYLYETMMGLNTLQSKQPVAPAVPTIPVAPWAAPGYNWNVNKPVTVPNKTTKSEDIMLQEPVEQFIPEYAYGGMLYAQNGDEVETGGVSILSNSQNMMNAAPLTFQQWVMEDPVRRSTASAPQEYQAYVNSFSAAPTNNVGPTATGTSTTAAPSFEPPKVEFTNRLAGGFNRVMDSRAMQGYGKLSNFAVNAAGFVNEIYKNKKAREAEGRLYEMTQADNAFGYFEDPVNKQGTWDVNTGLAEQDNRVEYMRAQQGGELNEIDLDPDTIAKLIAAGANIQIL